MTLPRPRDAIAVLWLSFLLINFVQITYLHAGGWIRDDYYEMMRHQLNVIYVPYVGIVLAHYFGLRHDARVSRRGELAAFMVAMFCSLIWNGLITYHLTSVVMLKTTVESAVRLIDGDSASMSWIAAPAIGFYFGRHALYQLKNSNG